MMTIFYVRNALSETEFFFALTETSVFVGFAISVGLVMMV